MDKYRERLLRANGQLRALLGMTYERFIVRPDEVQAVLETFDLLEDSIRQAREEVVRSLEHGR